MAVGEGFEPSRVQHAYGFKDRCHQPLGQPTTQNDKESGSESQASDSLPWIESGYTPALDRAMDCVDFGCVQPGIELYQTIMTDIERIRSRRQGIEREIKDAKLRISALTSEDQELEIAERVILRLSGSGTHGHSILPALRQEAHGVAAALREKGITSKPSDTPTMPEMITEVLQYAKLQGRTGLEPKEMAEYIAGKWWPEVSVNNVGPIAWRMMKRGQLIKPSKDAPRYSLPNELTPGSTEPSAPSHPDDGHGNPSSNESGEAATSLTEPPGASPAHPRE